MTTVCTLLDSATALRSAQNDEEPRSTEAKLFQMLLNGEDVMPETIQMDIFEAGSHLSRLAEHAWRGKRVVITKRGNPYLDLIPHVEKKAQRIPGRLKGKIVLDARFSQTTNDVVDDFM